MSIQVSDLRAYGFESALHGMRMPMLSFKQSDSYFGTIHKDGLDWEVEKVAKTYKEYTDITLVKKELLKNCVLEESNNYLTLAIIGKKDMELMRKLYKGGTEHRKYLRQIFVSFDIELPIFIFSELDTYKVGVVRNSGSFMHKGTSKPFEISDFSTHIEIESNYDALYQRSVWNDVIKELNRLRDLYLTSKDPEIFEQIRCLLPSGYNQVSTITMNYENVYNIIHQRSNHRLSEWREFCEILSNLPYIKMISQESDSFVL